MLFSYIWPLYLGTGYEFLLGQGPNGLIFFIKTFTIMAAVSIIGPRYEREDLEMFRVVILKKLAKAENSFIDLLHSLGASSNEASPAQKDLKDSESSTEGQRNANLAERQRFLISALERAIERVNAGTYGICKLTGNLISKERLLKVPHTEYSIEAKMPTHPTFAKTVQNKRVSAPQSV